MIAYRKQRRKVDPVKQILARVEERQNKSGLSLYSTKNNDEPSKGDILPMVHQLSDGASVSSKNTPFLADLSTARQKAHRRLNASSKHTMNESKEKSMQFDLRGSRQLNRTFPPAKPQKMAVGVNMNNYLGYSFSGWSESSSAGVENLRSSHYTTQSMNPFGYSRRTLAFQPTSLNYVVEWPETWPLKIMSLNKGMGRSLKKKPRTKPKDERRVHFERAPAHLSSPMKESLSSGVYIHEGVSVADRSSLELLRQQRPLPSVSTQPLLEEAVGGRDTQEDAQHGVQRHQCEAVSSDMLLPCIEPHREENLRGSSGVSSVSAESAYAMNKEIDGDHQLGESGSKVATVPPCTPTPDIPEADQEIGSAQLDSLADDLLEEGDEKKEEVIEEAGKVEGEDEVEEEEQDAQAKLMSVVSQIAAESSLDYKEDI